MDGGSTKLRPALVCLETTHNAAGGTVLPLDYLAAARDAADRAGAGLHIDGARIFNAAVTLGVPVAEVARRLGVTENRLHDWKKALATKGIDAFPGSGHLTPQEEEIRTLRAEVKRLEMERDILKKATAFFATQTN